MVIEDYLGLAVMSWAILLGIVIFIYLCSPVGRARAPQAFLNSPLEVRHAAEIAAGDAVVIKGVTQKVRKARILEWLIYALGLFGVPLGFYSSLSLKNDCYQLWGVSWQLVEIIVIEVVFVVYQLPYLIKLVNTYRRDLADGYVPARNTKSQVDFIAFKITPKILAEEKWLLRLKYAFILSAISVLPLIFLCDQFCLRNHVTSLSDMNTKMNQICLEELKKRGHGDAGLNKPAP